MVNLLLNNIEIETERRSCCSNINPDELKLISALNCLNKAGELLLDINPFDAEMESWQYEINIIYAAIERKLTSHNSK